MPEMPGEQWWELCSVGREDLLEVATEIQSLYSQPPAAYTDVKAALAVAVPSQSVATILAARAAEALLISSSPVITCGISPGCQLSLSPPTVATQNGGGSGGHSSCDAVPSPTTSDRVMHCYGCLPSSHWLGLLICLDVVLTHAE